MGSINSVFLWGLLILLIPIIVHLFEFRRIQIIKFSNVVLLNTVLIRKIPKSQFKRVLLLLIRGLFLLFLVFCFLNPKSLGTKIGTNGKVNILVDNSLGLLDDCENFDCLTVTKQLLRKQSSTDEVYQLKLNQDTDYKSYYGLEIVEHLSASLIPTRNMSSVSKNDIQQDALYRIISDFNSETLSVVDELLADSVQLELYSINRKFDSNIFIDSVFLETVSEGLSDERILKVKIKNSGKRNFENVLVKLEQNKLQLGSSAFDIGSEEVIELTFSVSTSENANYRIVIDDGSSGFDNYFYFSMPSQQISKVSLISNVRNPYLESVFGNTELFDLTFFTESSVDYDRLKNSNLIVLNSLNQIPSWFELSEFVGDIVIIPDVDIDIESYQKFLNRRVIKLNDTTSSSIVNKTLVAPFFSGLFDDKKEQVSLPNVQVSFDVKGVYTVLLSSKSPYLIQLDLERSGQKVYFFTGDINDLQRHSLFLPLMYRMVENVNNTNNAIYHPLTNDPIVIKTPDVGQQIFHLTGPSGDFIPEVYFNNAVLVISLPPDVILPGHYALTAGSDTVKMLSLNIPKHASIVDYHSAEELRKKYGNNSLVRVLDTGSMEQLEASIAAVDDGPSIWKYALLLALMFLIAETAIHRWLK
jgi:hypothetical protein